MVKQIPVAFVIWRDNDFAFLIFLFAPVFASRSQQNLTSCKGTTLRWRNKGLPSRMRGLNSDLQRKLTFAKVFNARFNAMKGQKLYANENGFIKAPHCYD